MIIFYYTSIVTWILASIAVYIMIIIFAIRTLGRKKNVFPRQSLTLSEKKLWICALLTIVLMERFVFVYSYVFKNNPQTAVNAVLMKQYFGALLLSLIWPPQLSLLLGSAAILVINHMRERASEIASVQMRYDRRVFIGTGIAFFLLIATLFSLLNMNRLHASLFYLLLICGKYVIYLVVILNIHERKEKTLGDGSSAKGIA